MLLLSGFAARADTSAETTADGFLMQHELDAMLSNLDASPWPTRYCFGYVDYAGKKWTAFDYVCPICGTRTSYPERTRISLWGAGYEAFLANLRQTVKFLRGKRLDVRVDERILCSACRKALNVPDRGELVALPTRWPPSRSFLSSPLSNPCRTNFPFRVGDKLRIVSEQNIWGWHCYCVLKENASYWIAAKDVSSGGKITARNTDSWVRLGPGESYPSVGFLNRSCEPESGVPMPETATNGWMRLRVANECCYYAYYVPTCLVGRLTSSGAALGRKDLFERLKWTINGREIEIESDDCLLLRTFFSGQREIPGREINASLKEARNRRRLGQLLSSRPPLSRKPNSEAVLKDLSRPGGWTNGEITVENF